MALAITFWDPSKAGPSQDLFLARIIPEKQGVNHIPLRTRSRAHGALRANFQPPGCCGQCSSGQLRAAQLDVRVRRLGLGPPCELRRRHRHVVGRWQRPNGVRRADSAADVRCEMLRCPGAWQLLALACDHSRLPAVCRHSQRCCGRHAPAGPVLFAAVRTALGSAPAARCDVS